MSIMPSADALALEKKARCKRFNVEDMYVDTRATMMREPDEKRKNMYGSMDEFRCPIVRWKVDGKWFAGAVPLVLEKNDRSDWLGALWHWELNGFAMDMELHDMIEKSKRGEVDEQVGQTIPRVSKVSIDVV